MLLPEGVSVRRNPKRTTAAAAGRRTAAAAGRRTAAAAVMTEPEAKRDDDGSISDDVHSKSSTVGLALLLPRRFRPLSGVHAGAARPRCFASGSHLVAAASLLTDCCALFVDAVVLQVANVDDLLWILVAALVDFAADGLRVVPAGDIDIAGRLQAEEVWVVSSMYPGGFKFKRYNSCGKCGKWTHYWTILPQKGFLTFESKLLRF
ncbi:hypothetical protein LWI28_026925 [Acer negundo]|uniref:Uncharacterized protein n=1 Tax=Acer negundo TaxID=4023 RepID=A0AAD5NVU0_ACENE|nr:hypothetical protein LWI28_026925 [Acer negundo]